VRILTATPGIQNELHKKTKQAKTRFQGHSFNVLSSSTFYQVFLPFIQPSIQSSAHPPNPPWGQTTIFSQKFWTLFLKPSFYHFI
jgi:hypothetical protein